MQRLLLGLIFLLAVACVNEQQSSTISIPTNVIPQSNDGTIPLRWDTANLPLSMKVGDTFSASAAQAIETMKLEWNQSGAAATFFTPNTPTTTNKTYASLNTFFDSELGIYLIDDWYSEIGSSALAVTQFFAARRNVGTVNEYMEIVHADILFNADFSFSTTGVMGSYDMASVALHELGHVLGLKHESTTTSIMYPYLGAGVIHRALQSIDKTHISELYGAAQANAAMTISMEALETVPAEEGAIVRGIVELLPNESERITLKATALRLPQKKKHNH